MVVFGPSLTLPSHTHELLRKKTGRRGLDSIFKESTSRQIVETMRKRRSFLVIGARLTSALGPPAPNDANHLLQGFLVKDTASLLELFVTIVCEAKLT